jgi:hypothetical protein
MLVHVDSVRCTRLYSVAIQLYGSYTDPALNPESTFADCRVNHPDQQGGNNMEKSNIINTILGTLLLGCAVSSASFAAGYGEDRALIEDLMARYLFALDFRDPETYAETFTEDGILDYGTGEIKGRQAIYELINGMKQTAQEAAAKDTSGLRPAAGRHNVSNMVIRINGNKAAATAYWFHHGNNNPERSSSVTSYGHYVDELEKVNGEWLFSKRKIYNEQVDEWAAPAGNPSW